MAKKRNDPNKTGAVKTERCLEGADASDRRRDFRVPGTPGLYFRVTPSGVTSWSLLYTDKRTGKKRRLSLGHYIRGQDKLRVEDRQGVTLAKARQLAREHIADVGNGADPARGVSLRREGLTARELFEKKVASMGATLGGRRRRSVDNYRSMFRRHVESEIADIKAAEVTKADIARLLDKVEKAEDGRFIDESDRKSKGNPRILTPGRKVSHQPNRVFEMLRSMFRYGVKKGLIEHNPMELMEPPVEVENTRDRYLSWSEIPSFWRSLETAPITRQLAIAMKLEIVTGQRTAMLMLRLKTDIDRSGSIPVLVVPRVDTKNKKFIHRVPLCPLAMRLIDEAMAIAPNSPFIFASPVTTVSLDPQSATQAMKRMRPSLEASDLRVHDLRRTASNGMRKLGISKFIISVALNHISVTNGDVTSEHYLDEFAFEPEKTDALFKWGAKLEEILGAAGLLQTDRPSETSVQAPSAELPSTPAPSAACASRTEVRAAACGEAPDSKEPSAMAASWPASPHSR